MSEHEDKENEVLLESLVEEVLETCLELLFRKEELVILNVEQNNETVKEEGDKLNEEGDKVEEEINVESSEDEVEVMVKAKKRKTYCGS